MKPKGRWIEKYYSELDDNQIIENIILNTSEILKLNIKPKVLWFVQHVLSEDLNRTQRSMLEEGEIVSDHEHDDGNDGRTLECKEIKHLIMPDCEETENPVHIPRSPRIDRNFNDREIVINILRSPRLDRNFNDREIAINIPRSPRNDRNFSDREIPVNILRSPRLDRNFSDRRIAPTQYKKTNDHGNYNRRRLDRRRFNTAPDQRNKIWKPYSKHYREPLIERYY